MGLELGLGAASSLRNTEKEKERPPSAYTPSVRAVATSGSSRSAAMAAATGSESSSIFCSPARVLAAVSAARMPGVALTGTPTTALSTERPPSAVSALPFSCASTRAWLGQGLGLELGLRLGLGLG